MNREADNVCSSCKHCGSAVTAQPMAFPSPIRASLKPSASSTPSTLVYKLEPSQDDQGPIQYSAITGHVEKGGMQDKFFDQEVELSIGHDGTKLTDKDIVKVESFDDLELVSRLSKNVTKAGYTKPTPIQKYAMKSIQNGKDLMACSQTGSGKTAAFLLPIMNRLLWDADLSLITDGPCKPQALILAPTRELALQIHAQATKFAEGTLVKCEIAYGGCAFALQRKRVEKGVIILVGTIGRIKHFINEDVISLEQTQYLVLDEADRMLDMGFAEDVKQIMESCGIAATEDEEETGRQEEEMEESQETVKREEKKNYMERQTLLFSATFPKAVQSLAKELLREDYLKIVVDKIGVANKNITQDFVQVERRNKKATLLKMVGVDLQKFEQSKDLQLFKQKTLIFVASKTMADTLGVFISEAGIPTTTTHGGREQCQREAALSDFRSGKTPILIATAVAERGLDISGVDHVINYDMPKEITDYIHRIGRTGRLGNPGHSTSFIDAERDYEILLPLVRQLKEAEQVVPDWLENLDGAHYMREEDIGDYTWGGTSFSKGMTFGGGFVNEAVVAQEGAAVLAGIQEEAGGAAAHDADEWVTSESLIDWGTVSEAVTLADVEGNEEGYVEGDVLPAVDGVWEGGKVYPEPEFNWSGLVGAGWRKDGPKFVGNWIISSEDSHDASNGEPEHARKLFIGGLTPNTTEEMMREFYGKFGELTDVVVMRDPTTKRTRGFGFVTYAAKTMARLFVDECQKARPHVIDGKTVDPKRAVPRDANDKGAGNVSSKRLYVSGIREEHTDEQLQDYFAKFGTIEKVDVIKDKMTNKNRGFAFITFDDYDCVDQCVIMKSHQINGYRCDVKKGLSKEETAKAQQSERDRMERNHRSRGNDRGGPMGGGGGGRYGDQGGYGGGGGQGGWGGYGGGAGGGGGGGQQGGGWGGYGGQQGGGGGGWGAPAAQGAWGGGGYGQQAGGYGGAPSGAQAWGQQPQQGGGAAAWGQGQQAWAGAQAAGGAQSYGGYGGGQGGGQQGGGRRY
uniref:RNA helicase n=1 Tax=Pristionchus pacificus TaxID=54126 RepID=A0A2A6CKB6_PRIPA|eukprot:PDM78546.1 helicase [Pristionchus pacificus]